MPIEIACPSCRKALQVPDYAAGKKARCPSCGEVIPVPARPRTVIPYEAPAAKVDREKTADVEFTAPAESIEIGQIWNESWETFTNHLGVLVGGTVIAGIIYFGAAIVLWVGVVAALAFAVAGAANDGNAAVMAPILIAAFVVAGIFLYLLISYLSVGMIRLALDASRNLPVQLSRLFSGTDAVVSFFGYWLLFTFLTNIGFYLLIIPGLWMMLAWWPGFFLIADRRAGAGDALGYAQRLTKGNMLNCFVIFLLVVAINFVGALLLGIGMIFSTPLALVLMTTTYRHLAGDPRTPENPAGADPYAELDDSPFA